MPCALFAHFSSHSFLSNLNPSFKVVKPLQCHLLPRILALMSASTLAPKLISMSSAKSCSNNASFLLLSNQDSSPIKLMIVVEVLGSKRQRSIENHTTLPHELISISKIGQRSSSAFADEILFAIPLAPVHFNDFCLHDWLVKIKFRLCLESFQRCMLLKFCIPSFDFWLHL